jgi:hypothetical protein
MYENQTFLPLSKLHVELQALYKDAQIEFWLSYYPFVQQILGIDEVPGTWAKRELAAVEKNMLTDLQAAAMIPGRISITQFNNEAIGEIDKLWRKFIQDPVRGYALKNLNPNELPTEKINGVQDHEYVNALW